MDRGMEAELELLTGEEKALLETLNGLKENLVQVSAEGGRKLEEIRRLTRKVDELKNGKKIRSRTSKKDAHEEREDAVLIFPEEVWAAIFGKISDPKDLWNLTNTCQLFDNILSSWKTGFMLGEALPYIYKDLPGGKLLECREVCKSWNMAVDTFLEDHPSVRPHNSDNINPRRLDFVNPIAEKGFRDRGIITFRNEAAPSIYEFPLIPTWARRNPFIGRFLILNLREYKPDPTKDNEDEDAKKFLEKISNFLTSFGEEIWYLDVQLPFGGEDGSHPAIIQFVSVDMFHWLPNLRELRMDCIGELAPPLLTPSSLPSLSGRLETLHIYNDLYLDPLSEVRMAKYRTQLRKVCVRASFSPFNAFCRVEWPNLTELQVSLIGDLVAVARLTRVGMPQLSKLVLNLEQFDDGTCFDYLLELIRRLSSNTRLDTLRLEGGHQSLKVLLLDKYNQAPSAIKTLELEHWREGGMAPNYTFLLHHFPFVENLHLYLRTSLENDYIGLRSQEECLGLAVRKGLQEMVEIVEVNKYVYRGQMYREKLLKK